VLNLVEYTLGGASLQLLSVTDSNSSLSSLQYCIYKHKFTTFRVTFQNQQLFIHAVYYTKAYTSSEPCYNYVIMIAEKINQIFLPTTKSKLTAFISEVFISCFFSKPISFLYQPNSKSQTKATCFWPTIKINNY